MSMRNGIIAFVCALAAAFVLLGIGSVYDVQAAEILFTGDGVVTVGAEIFGKMPLFLAVGIACAMAFYTVSRGDGSKGAKVRVTIVKAVYLLGGVASCAFMFMDLFDLVAYNKLMSLALCALSGAAVFTLLTLIFARISAQKLHACKKWALAVIVAAVVIVCLTELVKQVWGRARPFEVKEGANFTPWYKPSDAGGESFFSGHAACCMGLLAFAPLFRINNVEPIYRVMYFVLSVVFICAVLLARMMCGAHYLTDVAFGAIISMIVIFVVGVAAFRNGYEVKPGGFIEKYL